MKIATNNKTGEQHYWDGNKWLPLKIGDVATNNKTGEKRYWDGTQWSSNQNNNEERLGLEKELELSLIHI